MCKPSHNGHSPHRNTLIDKIYQKELQESYFCVFDKEEYTIEEINKIIGYEKKDLDKRFKAVKKNEHCLYNKEDVIRKLMGGRML